MGLGVSLIFILLVDAAVPVRVEKELPKAAPDWTPFARKYKSIDDLASSWIAYVTSVMGQAPDHKRNFISYKSTFNKLVSIGAGLESAFLLHEEYVFFFSCLFIFFCSWERVTRPMSRQERYIFYCRMEKALDTSQSMSLFFLPLFFLSFFFFSFFFFLSFLFFGLLVMLVCWVCWLCLVVVLRCEFFGTYPNFGLFFSPVDSRESVPI